MPDWLDNTLCYILIILRINDTLVTSAQQLLFQLGQSSGSSQPGNWGIPCRRIHQSGDSPFPENERDVTEQKMWANSWTSLLGSVWVSLGTAANREGRCCLCCLCSAQPGCHFPGCSSHEGSRAVVHVFSCGCWTALNYAKWFWVHCLCVGNSFYLQM